MGKRDGGHNCTLPLFHSSEFIALPDMQRELMNFYLKWMLP